MVKIEIQTGLSGWSFTFQRFCYNQGGEFLPDFACSNEPCTDKSTSRHVELARKRQDVDLDVYGECRDSEQKGKQKRFVR
jgi:hypothetical protein